MMRRISFNKQHLVDIVPQEKQEYTSIADATTAQDISDEAYTWLEGTHIVACAGLVVVDKEHAIVWATLSNLGPRNFLRLHKQLNAILDRRKEKYICMLVDTTYDKAQRWAALLGFENTDTITKIDDECYFVYYRTQK